MLSIGTDESGRYVYLSDVERSRHIHIVGPTGSGKTRLLNHLIRQDVKARRGFCLIDPKGDLADSVETWCASRGFGRTRRIHLVRPGAGVFTAGFNPLRVDRGEHPMVRVDAAVRACAAVWGDEDLNRTPRLLKILRATFFALAARNLTLAEALMLLRPGDPERTRQLLTAGLPDDVFQTIWDDLNGLPRREFAEYVESTVSRLAHMLASPAVRSMLGLASSALDFRQIMDEGDIVIVNLKPSDTMSGDGGRLLGALIINDLFLTALTRTEAVGRRHPFTLYIDECYEFLSSDIEGMLDRTRSLGLHVVLAHQRLGQLTESGRNLYSAVVGSARTKVVFGGLQEADTALLARELLRDEIDLQRPNPILRRRVVVGDFITELGGSSWTRTRGTSRTETTTRGTSTTTSESTSSGEHFSESGQDGSELRGTSQSTGSSVSQSDHYSVSWGDTTSASENEGGTRYQAVRNVWGMAHTSYTLEEHLHLAQVHLAKLPERHILVKRSGKSSVCLRTPDVPEPLCSPRMLARFREHTQLSSRYVARASEAAAEVSERRLRLAPAPVVSENFWSEE